MPSTELPRHDGPAVVDPDPTAKEQVIQDVEEQARNEPDDPITHREEVETTRMEHRRQAEDAADPKK